MDQREAALTTWIQDYCHLPSFEMRLLQGDASFRRYFRVKHSLGTLIAMDAPPEREKVLPFIHISKMLCAQGLKAPEIFEKNIEEGFLLISDFGDQVLLKMLEKENASTLYALALDALAQLQSIKPEVKDKIPFFTAELMRQELSLFQEWFLEKHLNLDIDARTQKHLDAFFDFLAERASRQSQVFMHRDFHSGNLMLLEDGGLGILDFQDAFMGPVTYDLASLLKDCYIDWPLDFVRQEALAYKKRLAFLHAMSDAHFLEDFDWMGVQRHLKALLTFSRKLHRDGNPEYLIFMPRTLTYVNQVTGSYELSKDFHQFLRNKVLPAFQRVSLPCEP